MTASWPLGNGSSATLVKVAHLRLLRDHSNLSPPVAAKALCNWIGSS